MKSLNIAAQIMPKQTKTAKAKPQRTKQSKRTWVAKATLESLQKAKGEIDALTEVLEEKKSPLNEGTKQEKPQAGFEPQKVDAKQGNGTSHGNSGPKSARVVASPPNPYFRVCHLENEHTPAWLPALGLIIPAIMRQCGADLGSVTAVALISVGALCAVRSNMRKAAIQRNRRSMRITRNIETCTMDEMVDAFNEGQVKDWYSLYHDTADLIGQHHTSEDEVRPPHHQASKCQQVVTLQLWRVASGGVRRHLIVNGDLFAELLGQNHSKLGEARNANINMRTSNPAEYNVSAGDQAIINAHTAELGRLFLGENFH